jgi:F-type H+-transporting ATPase subunit beta
LLGQPFCVAETFTNKRGLYLSLHKTIPGFENTLDGYFDELDETYFDMTGGGSDLVAALAKQKLLYKK